MKMGAASNVDQVHQLEETLQGYRRQLAQLESQLDASSSHLSEARARCSLVGQFYKLSSLLFQTSTDCTIYLSTIQVSSDN